MNRFKPVIFYPILLLLLLGCESNWFDHDPPVGMGSLIVNNNTYDDIHVYFNGSYTNDVSDYDYEIFDMKPGLYRVLLDQKEGIRSFYDELDVLEGKLTILDVTVGYDRREYDVYVYFD